MMAPEDLINKGNKRDIFKKFFKFEKRKPVDTSNENGDAEGLVLFEDPPKANISKKNNFSKTSKMDKNKLYRAEGEDYMIDDFVVIEAEGEQKLQMVNRSNLKSALIDFTAGSLAGIAQVYVAQPLDTVKVKLQTFPKLYKNALKCFLHTYRANGIVGGLYAGTLPAVVASTAENSVLFTTYGACQKVVAFIMDIDKVDELSALDNACAGFLAGFFSTFFMCPTELVKCKLQAVHEMKQYVAKDSMATPISTLKLTRDILSNEGISGFYRGLSSTFVREMSGFFFFFGGYEVTREFFTQPEQTKDDIGALRTMCAGAVGGVALWTFTFPADVIKTRIQIHNFKGSMLSIGSDILRKEGILAFYNGLLPTLLRTVPATAILFVVYEYSKKILANQF